MRSRTSQTSGSSVPVFPGLCQPRGGRGPGGNAHGVVHPQPFFWLPDFPASCQTTCLGQADSDPQRASTCYGSASLMKGAESITRLCKLGGELADALADSSADGMYPFYGAESCMPTTWWLVSPHPPESVVLSGGACRILLTQVNGIQQDGRAPASTPGRMGLEPGPTGPLPSSGCRLRERTNDGWVSQG